MSAADQVPHDESSPLLENQVQEDDMKKATAAKVPTSDSDPVKGTPTQEASHVGYVWAADGVPMTAVGEPVGRTQWNSSLFTCLGRNDEFCSSDLEVCLLGTMAPCILYGSNAERLGSSSTTFASHCMAYCGLYLFGSSFLGFSLAPFFSYTTRTALRRKFNLEGSYEAFHRSCGCCGSPVEDNLHRERCETACDMLTHVFCHTCALCQEGRELRRRLPHPGFGAHSVLVTIPPGEQTMNRTKA